jgi:NAD(P)-dependent dehydrogenase (short-subunit alcohol dehydrogenase family)
VTDRVRNRVVAVTGGARGIGHATAAALLAAGARVAIGDLDGELADRAAEALGRGCRGYALDVTDPASFDAFLDAVERDLGPLDVLVNNAGVMLVGDFLDMDQASDDVQVDVNLRGVLTGMRLAGRRMRERRTGHIVSIASMAGLVGAPGGLAYSATKHAVVGASAALRAELRSHDVTVSTVCPSIVRTELGGGLGSLAVPPVEPEDVARAVLRVLRTRRTLVAVPAWLLGLRAAVGWLPVSAQEGIARALGSDRALTEADPLARAAYEARARRASRRSGTAA